jgi:pantetheine-phosphate adenylyltransferase
MAADVETVFLMPKADYSYVSSSIVREVAALGGEIREFVSPEVAAVLARRFPQLKP